jgi:hypothetical protein
MEITYVNQQKITYAGSLNARRHRWVYRCVTHIQRKVFDSSGVYICKPVENDLKHGNYICKSEVIYL